MESELKELVQLVKELAELVSRLPESRVLSEKSAQLAERCKDLNRRVNGASANMEKPRWMSDEEWRSHLQRPAQSQE